MNPTISIPTDNVYKFYAMFGLVIMLTTAIMFFIRHEEYNRRAFERHVPMKLLEMTENLNDRQEHELYLYEQKATIDKSNKKFELRSYMFLFFLPGVLLTVYGFFMWHTKIQPMQDSLLELQLERLKAEIKAANKEARRARYTRR